MPKKKKPIGIEIDWYLISISTLKKFGLGILIVLLAIGGFFYNRFRNSDPKQRAVRAISDAQDSLDRLASSKEFASVRADFDRAKVKFDESKSLLGLEKYGDALSAAVESQTLAQAALSRQPGQQDADAQFLTVEGEVSFQKSGGDWRPAEVRTPLFSGDWVKTGGSSTAELMFSNGSLYTIGPNGLLEIYSMVNPQTSKKQNSVKMQIGSIVVNTDDENSTVRTRGMQVFVDSKSTAQVGVDSQAQSTEVVNLRGQTSVASATGGPAVQLATGQKMTASADGALSAISKVTLPPALTSPADNQVFQSQPGLTLDLQWDPVEGAAGYRLQVSRSRLFTTIEIDSRRNNTKATVRPTDQGAFYWRVASVDAASVLGPYSTFRRFRVTGSSRPSSLQTPQGDKTPPTLQVKRPFNIGGQFYMIEGQVEPGASVYVNDEEIDVDTSGAFKKFVSFDKVGWNTVVIKAVDAAGNQTVQRENVYVEE